jgi:nicotinamide riboside transporter PnuC
MTNWVITAFSLFATVLNIRKQKACFVIWIFTNACWCVVDAAYGIYAQSMLHLVYFFLAIWGVVEWTRNTKDS